MLSKGMRKKAISDETMLPRDTLEEVSDGINPDLDEGTARFIPDRFDKSLQDTNFKNPIPNLSACPLPLQPFTLVINLPPLHFLDYSEREAFVVLIFQSLREQLLDYLQTVLADVSDHVIWVPELAEQRVVFCVMNFFIIRLDSRRGFWLFIVPCLSTELAIVTSVALE
jgi:hypothetical protein